MRLRNLFAVLAVALPLAGCSLFTKQNARTANDIARDLCQLHYQEVKPGLSLEEIGETFCKDVRPWLDFVLATQRSGLPSPTATPAP